MSIWADIQDKSAGDSISQEDFNVVYPGKNETQQDKELFTGKYKNSEYKIFTTGKYPYIAISMNKRISAFSGYQLVKLEKRNGDGYYDLDRTALDSDVRFVYFCNHTDDYIVDDHDGKKYSLDILQSLAEKIIDLIQMAEKKYQDARWQRRNIRMIV